MRLWHQSLIPYLPRQQLLGQHRECCALRGNGWGKKHTTVNYVFEHDPIYLSIYHRNVILEMNNRGYKCETNWIAFNYRGKNMNGYPALILKEPWGDVLLMQNGDMLIYPEHDEDYLNECLVNLFAKYECGRIKQADWDKIYEKFGENLKEIGFEI